MREMAMQDLRTANGALANELIRVRAASEQESSLQRKELEDVRAELAKERERHAETLTRATEAAAAQQDAEGKHKAHLKELQRRLRDEHMLRQAAEKDLAALSCSMDAAAQQLQQMQAAQEESAVTLRCAQAEAARLQSLQDALAAAERREETGATAVAELQRRAAAAEARVVLLEGREAALQGEVAREKEAHMVAVHAQHEAQSKLAALSQQMDGLRDTLQAAKQQLTEAQGARAAAEQATSCAEVQAATLQRQLEERTSTAASAQEIAADATQQVSSLREQVAVIQRQLDAKVAEVARLHEANAAAAGSVRKAERALAAREADCEAARAEATRAREDAAARLENAQRSVQALEGELRKADAAQRQCDSLRKALGTEKETAAALQRQLNDVYAREGERDAALRAQQQAAALAQQEGHAAAAQASALQAQIEARDAEIARKSGRVRELSATVETLKEHCAALHSGASTERKALEERCAVLQAEVQATAAQLAQVKEALKGSEAIRGMSCSEVAALQCERAGLQAQLEEAQRRESAMREHATAQAADNDKELEAKARIIADLMAAMQHEERAKAEAMQEARLLHNRAAELQDALSNVMREKSRVEDAYASTCASLNSMRRKADHYREENVAFMSQYDSYLNALATNGSPLKKEPLSVAGAVRGTPPRIGGVGARLANPHHPMRLSP